MEKLLQKSTQIRKRLEQNSEDANDDRKLLKRVHNDYKTSLRRKSYFIKIILQPGDQSPRDSPGLSAKAATYQ